MSDQKYIRVLNKDINVGNLKELREAHSELEKQMWDPKVGTETYCMYTDKLKHHTSILMKKLDLTILTYSYPDDIEQIFKQYDKNIAVLKYEVEDLWGVGYSGGFTDRSYTKVDKVMKRILDDVIKIKENEGEKPKDLVILRELPIKTLSLGYAHLREDGSIRRYFLPHVISVVSVRVSSEEKQTNSNKIDKALRTAIAEQEGYDPQNIAFVHKSTAEPKYVNSDVTKDSDIEMGIRLNIIPLPDEFIELFPEQVLGALESQNHKQLVTEYDKEIEKPTFFRGLLLKILKPVYNWRLAKNKLVFNMIHSKNLFDKLLHKLVSIIDNGECIRKLTICKFLAIRASESNVGLAVAKMALELKQFTDLGLVRGQLTEPFILSLVNDIGDDEPKYVVASYFHVPLEHEDTVEKLGEFIVEEGAEGKVVGEITKCKMREDVHITMDIKLQTTKV